MRKNRKENFVERTKEMHEGKTNIPTNDTIKDRLQENGVIMEEIFRMAYKVSESITGPIDMNRKEMDNQAFIVNEIDRQTNLLKDIANILDKIGSVVG